MLMVICTILSPSLTTSSAGALTDFLPRDGLCSLSTEERLKVQRHIQNGADIANAGGVTVAECGPGPWLQIADFDSSSTSSQCPPELELVGGGCRRPDINGGCTMSTFSTGGIEYSKVCGRIIGAAFRRPDSFRLTRPADTTVTDGIRLIDGVTITHSMPIQHIWTLSAAQEVDPDFVTCPCKANDNAPGPTNSAAVVFAGNNYFCDTTFRAVKLLWNGECSPITDPTLAGCCGFNNPPFFTATLPIRTSANVDVRLCRNENRMSEDVFVQIMQLYVQ